MTRVNATKIFFLFFLIAAIAPQAIASNFTDKVLASWSMENLPSSVIEDDSGTGATLTLNSPTNMSSNTYYYLGNWGIIGNRTNGDYAYKTPPDFNTQIYDGNITTVSFWWKPLSGANKNYDLVTYGKSGGWVATVGVADQNDRVFAQLNGDSSCTRTLSANGPSYNMSGEGLYYHLVVVFNKTSSTTGSAIFYLNGNKTTTNLVAAGSGSGNTLGTDFFVIGNYPLYRSCGFDTGNVGRYAIDQVMVYNRSLTDEEVSELYASGTGYDPFDNTLPEQIASISSIDMVFESSASRDFSQYFSYDTYVQLAFIHNNATHSLSYSLTDTYSSSDFAIQFTSPTTIAFWSFNNVVVDQEINVSACNPYGCTSYTPFYLSVGYNGTGVYQIASVADVSMNTNSVAYRTISSYFVNHENIFVQFTDPDNFSTVYVTEGYPANNSCAYIEVSDDNVIYRSNTAPCSISNVFYIVDDNTQTITSNGFRVSVTGTNATVVPGTIPGGVGGVVNLWGSIFPSYDTISFQVRMGYVLVVMLLTLIAGVIIAYNSGGSALSLIGVGAVLFVEFIYFTAIRYIPILWIVLFAILMVVLGAGYFVRKTSGTGG